MKHKITSITSTFKNIQGFSLIVGMAFGAAIALVLFCYLVPGGRKMIGLYNYKMASIMSSKNNQDMSRLMAKQHAMGKMPGMNHVMSTSSNPYMMEDVTSEKQFLQDMKLHHEAAVVMAEQVLLIKNIHPDIENFALSIISAQSEEIRMMKEWMTLWKY